MQAREARCTVDRECERARSAVEFRHRIAITIAKAGPIAASHAVVVHDVGSGEHCGDPASVVFCHSIGLDYVSCSPFRVPIARLAAAQAALSDSK